MIIVASQRAGAKALADHLMNDRDNDHLTLATIDGFMADDLHGALEEAEAISLGTQCTQFMFSVSLNPPADVIASDEQFEETAERVAQIMGLEGQPYALVIHEKQGRRHAHVVWSRIDSDTMTAINLPHFKLKMRDLSREMFLDHGWELPKGLKSYGQKDPLNFTLSEWQQAQRIGSDPRELKPLFQEAWAQSDDAKSLKAALADKGLYIAKGDRRGVVALDIQGNIYALARWTGVKSREVKARLGDALDLQPLSEVQNWLKTRKTSQVQSFVDQVKNKQARDMQPMLEERAQMVTQQRAERSDLKAKQDARWQREVKERSDRLNKGLRGLFDRMTGAHQAMVKRNETEALACLRRDQEQRDRLIHAQMAERRELQARATNLKAKHMADRKILAQQIVQYMNRSARGPTPAPSRTRRRNRGPNISR
ncbi:relaxase/mobilization nuclease domain-containing protein [uncultured Roseobacter sp.]|uniref:relaxase/mobilization nuclease domain-containing protein n=1 Tax=uncultured Roseobacter sp. TaxID=114847 RepID=UPI00261611C2|nr:relaxase/mobilization nuclease domain-containing protein [uncultured Roseobacter sp.]